MTIRNLIKKRLASYGWSAYRLGQESGIPIRTVQGYLRGSRDMTGEKLEAIFKALDIEIKPKQKNRGK